LEFSDEYFMRIALQQARLALDAGEVPVGALIVSHQKILAKAYNQVELLKDITAHAEIIAITAATNSLGGKYLENAILYVTLEPCMMCLGACANAHIRKIVFGTEDTRKALHIHTEKMQPPIELIGGVFAEESAALLRDFFARKRQF